MKNLFKIIFPTVIAFTMVSCMTNSGAYANNYDPYSQGYSNGYIDGYHQSPDGFWYAPNVVYLDNNNNYYRNGAVYNSRSNSRNNVVISPRRNSLHNQISTGNRPTTQPGVRSQESGTRNQNNIRVQPNTNTNRGTRNQIQNNTRVQPQNNTRSGSQNNIRVQPQVQQESSPQRSNNGSR
ncbi:hypothetical protein D3C87_675550 [compost metagenome]